MTALTKYARIEATGLWRPTPDVQRREVIVSIGEATLVIADLKDQALAHWSLAAVERSSGSELPAIYHPDGDPGETLELPEGEGEMIDAIETLRRAIDKSRPKPGRLRWAGMLVSFAVVAGFAVFWLPAAMRDHTLTVVPDVKRSSIGAALLRRIERVSGPKCADANGMSALARLSARLNAGELAVLPDMPQPSIHLPGGKIILSRNVIEDHEEPDVAAGYVLTEMANRIADDPLLDLLSAVGIRENFRLLTTGDVSDVALDRYAKMLMTQKVIVPETLAHLAQFETAKLRSTPYAYAVDITGETVLALIEGDPMAGKLTEPLMTDADWLRLQNICGG